MADKIHVDATGPYHPLLGGRYGGMTDQQAAALEPKIHCPSCGALVVQLSDTAKERYCLPRDLEQADPDMVFAVDPCRCAVSVEWAGAFGREISSRSFGNPPREVQDITPAHRYWQHGILGTLFDDLVRGLVNTTTNRRPLQYRLVIVYDRMVRLVPGSRCRDFRFRLDPEITAWADSYGLNRPLPPGDDKANVIKPDFGYSADYPMPEPSKPAKGPNASNVAAIRDGFFRRISSPPPFAEVLSRSELQPAPGPVLDAPASSIPRRRVSSSGPADLD